MLEAISPYVDENISKTFNLPSSVTVKQIEQLLLEGFKRGLKGITIFREGCLIERHTT